MNLITSSLIIFLLLAVTAWSKPKHKRLFNSYQKNYLWKQAEIKGIAYCQNPYCKVKLVPFAGEAHSFEADHKKPFSKGGLTVVSNGLALCKLCNRAKKSYYHKDMEVVFKYIMKKRKRLKKHER